MKIKTSELQGAALDWAVAKAMGEYKPTAVPNYSTDWAQGGPIIERENIEIKKGNPLYFPQGNEKGDYYEDLWIAGKMHGPTPLIAAMRCYVASKLGDEVEVPDELHTV
jgi:hypothetical protein